MLKKRLIAIIIVRDGEVVQSVQFEHTNTIHYSATFAVETFSNWSIDELCLINVSREKTGQEKFVECVDAASRECFVPLSVGGWIDNENYAATLVRRGADKLVINSAFHDDPELVKTLSLRFGKQCIVGSLDCKLMEGGSYGVAIDRGRRSLPVPPAEWASQMEELGAGEILFNSISFDGARKGYDLENLRAVCDAVSIPVIAFGGVFRWKHMVEGINTGADAVAAANIFHYTEQSTRRAKQYMADAGIAVRTEGRWLGGSQVRTGLNKD